MRLTKPAPWRPAIALLFACIALPGVAEESSAHGSHSAATVRGIPHSDDHPPHHLSILVAETLINGSSNDGLTIGLDYEYRLSRLLGVGVVVERAAGAIDATTVFAVADLHIWRGLAVQVGLGSEYIEETAFLAARAGVLYEFVFDSGYTLSPQVHFDASDENSIVWGVSFGKSF